MNPDLEIWNEAAGVWAKNVTVDGSLRTIQLKSVLDRLLPDVKGTKILDAGCGDGVFTEYLSKKGAEVVGIDGAEEMVRIAQGRYPHLKFQSHDLMQPLPFPEAEFGTVLASMVLMHLSSAQVFMAESKRVLKPGGTLVFSVLHPCFNFPTMQLYKTVWDKLLFRKPSGLSFNYYQVGVSRRYESTTGSNLTHYHRTIEEYSKELVKAGFAIRTIIEPHELPEGFLESNPKLEYATRLPRFIFFNCKPL